MLTRRQARLLGLTTSDEGQQGTTHSGEDGSHDRATAAASHAGASAAGYGDDVVSLSSGGSSSGVPGSSLAAAAPPGTSIVLRLSASTAGRSGGTQLSSSSSPFTSTPAASPVAGLELYGAVGGRGSRIGVRQVEAMLSSAQAAVTHWSASGTTAGPVIQLTSALPSSSSSSSLYTHPTRRLLPLSASGVVQPGPSRLSDSPVSSASGSRGEEREEDSRDREVMRVAPRQGSAPSLLPSSSSSLAAAVPTTTATMTRLSAAQLRSRWRGVVRNCTTLQVPAKASQGGVSSLSLSVAASLSSPSRANVKGDAGVSPDGVSMERTHHVLHLTSASAERGDGITAGAMSSSSSNNSNGSSSVHASEHAVGTPVAVLQHPHGIHRDMTASPVVSSRRSTTFFISPYQSDAAHPLTAAASKSVSSSSRTDGTAPLPLQPGVAAGGKPSASRRRLMTALALRQHKAAKASAWQRRLVHEVYNHVYVKAHEARMRLLFGLPDSSTANTRAESSDPQCSDGVMHGVASLSTSSPGNAEMTDAIAAGEAAYMQSLNPARSEEEARVLQVIASIDAALKQQIASAYHHSLAGANSSSSSDRSHPMNSCSGGDDQGDGSGQAGSRLALGPDESNRHHRLVVAASELPSSPLQPALSRSADSTTATTTTCTAATDAHAAARFSERRPAILEAVIASTTQRVEAFTDQLLPYQQEGVRWLLRLNTLEHMNGILADDMGLGKTAQTVVYLSCYKDMVEAEVQRPLMVLRQRLLQHCQRVLNVTTCSSASPTGSSSSSSNGGGADEGGGELPPWLEWWAIAAESEGLDAEADGRASDSDGGAGVAPAHQRFTAGPFAGGAGGAQLPLPLVLSTDPAANAQLRAAESCGQTLRLVKEVKRWVWQLDDTQDGNDGSDDGGEAGRGRGRGQLPRAAPHSPSEVASPSSPLSPAGEQYGALEQSGEAVSMGAAVRVLSASVTASAEAPLVVRKRRGRPPKHLSAMLASTAVVSSRASGRRSGDEMQQAAGRDAASTGPSRSSATASPAPAPASSVSVTLPALMEHHSALATCSAALNARLDGSCWRFRPVLIIAPLSTLPHWADEFRRFSRRRSGGGGGNGGAADRDGSQRAAGAATGGASKSAMAAGKATPAAEEGHAASAGERFTVYVLNGPRTEREDRMRAFLADVQGLEESPLLLQSRYGSPTPVLVIPHDMLTKPLSGPLRQISRVRWHVVVIDEAQRIKSAQSTLYKKVRLLSSISRLVLTGTPLQNNTTELFSLLQFLSPQSFSNTAGSLFERLDSALMAASRSTALQDRELHILLCRRVHRLLMPFILRREKSILKASLPPMRDYAVLCPLMPYQETQLAEVRRRHEEGTLSGNPHIQSRKILLHPYTTQSFFYVDEQVVQTSGKLLVLDFMMRFLQRTRHKFLIFCGWTLVLDVVETLCGMRHIPFVRLDGRTPVEKRESNIRGFNRPAQGADAEGPPGQQLTSRRGTPRRSERGDDAMDDDADAAPAPCCFLISKVAGGVGLNLQAADTVFLLDVDYNPQRDAQALSRVYRVGQTREVRVFRLVIDHPIERDVVAIHEAKENLGRAVVQAGRYDLHSSVREREEALQHIFRAGTLSQLSQQWTAASPSSAAAAVTEAEEDEEKEEEATTATTGDDEYASSPSPIVGSEADDDEQVMDNEEGEREKYDGCSRRGLCREDDEGDSSSPSSPSPAETPTELQRILLRVSDPVPSALKKPKTETFPIKKEEGAERGDAAHVNGHGLLHSSAAPLPFPSGLSALPSPPSSSLPVLLTSQSTPSLRRKRRHISFKLEGEKESEDGEEEGGDGKRSKESSSSSSGSMNGHRAGSLDDGQVSLTNGTIYSADAALPADSSDPSAAAAQPVELSPAAHLLAMRERLEEVLLRHDGERVVLHDMFRTLEASLARTG